MVKEDKPASLQHCLVDVPAVSWGQIGGYGQAKATVQRALDLCLRQAELWRQYGVTPVRGLLLYGPPGCSKTLFARAVANHGSYFFLGVKGPELFSKYVGDSEKAIRDIFNRARACSPTVIFFDEVDALAAQRSAETDVADRVLITLLTELDGLA